MEQNKKQIEGKDYSGNTVILELESAHPSSCINLIMKREGSDKNFLEGIFSIDEIKSFITESLKEQP